MILTKGVCGSENVQKPAYVIFEWSLPKICDELGIWQHKYSTERQKNDHSLSQPTQSFYLRNKGMVPKLEPVFKVSVD